MHMRIADQCKEGGHMHDGYTPKCAWSDDCFVQWGGSGLVFGKEKSYTTAFFEAFPKSPDTFIRGEGKTIDEAETNAFAEYSKIVGCKMHEFKRMTKSLSDTRGICMHCGLFQCEAFKIDSRCSICNRITGFSSDAEGKYYCELHVFQKKSEHKTEHPMLQFIDKIDQRKYGEGIDARYKYYMKKMDSYITQWNTDRNIFDAWYQNVIHTDYLSMACCELYGINPKVIEDGSIMAFLNFNRKMWYEELEYNLPEERDAKEGDEMTMKIKREHALSDFIAAVSFLVKRVQIARE